MKKLVLSSPNQLARLLDNNPVLLEIPGLSPLKTVSHQLARAGLKKCSACSSRNSNLYANARPQMEAALANLTTEDYITMKKILGMDQVCYWHKINGKLAVTCL